MLNTIMNCTNCNFYKRATNPLEVGQCSLHGRQIPSFMAIKYGEYCDDWKGMDKKKLVSEQLAINILDSKLRSYASNLQFSDKSKQEAKCKAYAALDLCSQFGLISFTRAQILFNEFCEKVGGN